VSYKTYPEYKNSNNIWAGKIPIHWEIHKIKNLIFFQEGPGLRNWQFTDDGVRVICVTNITSNGIDFSNYEKFISEDEYKQTYSHFTVDQGDLLLSSSGNSWGKVAEYTDDETVILNTSTIRINKNPTSDYELKQPYIKWALQSEYIREQLGLMMTGSCQPNFGPTHLAKVSILMPTIKEQQQIANYLDKKTAKIDETIAKNERLIELLEEKRTALINQVVTKGLNPDVPMKDSGVEWIGEIPEHWDINNLNYAASDDNYSFVDGPFGSDLKNEEYVDEGIPIIQLNNIKVGFHDFSNERFITEEKYNQLKKHSIKPGHIVIAKMAEPVARGTIVSDKYEKYTIVADCIKLACNNKFSNRYVTYSLNSYIYHEAVQKATGTTRVRINLQEMKKLKLLIPPLEEQKEISDYLDIKISNINYTITKIKENINLLDEYKTSLIHHVVTGKIKVSD